MTSFLRFLVLAIFLVFHVAAELPEDMQVRAKLVPRGEPHPNKYGKMIQDYDEKITVYEPNPDPNSNQQFTAKRQFFGKIKGFIGGVQKAIDTGRKVAQGIQKGANLLGKVLPGRAGEIARNVGNFAGKANKGLGQAKNVVNQVRGGVNQAQKVVGQVKGVVNNLRGSGGGARKSGGGGGGRSNGGGGGGNRKGGGGRGRGL
ncbi:Aste57867_18455 [Aphanomyces stellatus]|uniref:Aste57867_18455 protein n=1 Tax=Aphanomyces stellatus TaxID=120398 RepID=A0A485LAD4_9STRA|nr:hypothetical protein As57867_018393 [Aphanomyces stellatus]VFT95191.1 Aste57867_18455 [Aphanomyces stellatus]